MAYDLTVVADGHHGGEVVLRQVAGHDDTDAFYYLHHREVLVKFQSEHDGLDRRA